MNLSRSIFFNITTAIVCFLAVLNGAAATRVRPPDSLLVSSGAYYRYQGKPVNLLEFTDRVSIVYKDNARTFAASSRSTAPFRGKTLQQIRRGKNPVDILTFDRPLLDHARKSGFAATIDSLRGLAAADRSISLVNPVYYNRGAGDEVVITDRILVKFADTTDMVLRSRIATLLDAVPENRILPGVYCFLLNNSGTTGVFERIRLVESIAGIDWVEPELLTPMTKSFLPDDTYFNKQWHLNNLGLSGGRVGADLKAAAAWDIWRGDASVTVAILDDGVDLGHPDLNIAAGGKDYCGSGDNDPSPDSASDSHGTAVAGVAAAIGNNSIGVAGVCPGAKILPLKICLDDVFVSHQAIALAMTYADLSGAAILNNSWGGNTPTNTLSDAIRAVSKDGRSGKGCLVFCASGNDGTTFETQSFSISGNATLDIAFVYQKDASGSAGNDLAAIDNVVVLSADQSTVIAMENFSGTSLPTGWSTSGGLNGITPPVRDNSVAGWSRTTTLYDGGYGGRSAYRSGAIGDDRWTELRMPRRTFSAGQVVRFSATVSSEENGDSLRVRAYNTDGSIAFDVPFVSGIDSASVPTIAFPAGADSSIAVGSSNDQDYRSAYSQFDVAGTAKSVDFLAPSGGGISDVYSTDRRVAVGYTSQDYSSGFSGTSSACPAAAGVAALILSRNPQLSRNKVLEVMRTTCDQIGDIAYVGGKNSEYGYGRLNAQRALTNLPPVITGQHAVGGIRGAAVALSTDDLVIYDVETPTGPFALSVSGGSNYTVNGTTITPASGFSGTLSVPVTVRDGSYESDRFLLFVNIRGTNSAPVVTAQLAMSMLEDGKRLLSATDFTITDADDAGPFTLVISPGADYTVVNDTVFPAPDFNGALSVSVAANDGYATGPAFLATITVTSVNDAPSFVRGADLAVNEDMGVFSAGWATAISRGPSNESGQSIGFIVTTTNGTLFQAAPSLSNAGVLSFTPKANISGSAQVSVRLNDGGGTANGGVASSAQITFSITVQPINDPPVFTAGTNDTVVEDAGIKTVAQWAQGIGAGAPDETGQVLDFIVTTSNDALFAVLPAITATGTLAYTPAANAFGSVLVTVRLHDDGSGTNLSVPATFTIIIDQVNDVPSFTAGSNVSCNEDAGMQSSGWATAISAGPGETGQTLSFITATTSTPASLFSTSPAIGSDGVLAYTPAPNVSGSAVVNVRLRDNGGTARSGVDSSVLRSFTITVNAVNDPPVFGAGPAVSVTEDAGAQALAAWASMSAGPSDENGQAITRSLAVTNTSLFSVQPGIAADGTLTFTPAANSFGTAQVTVTLTDNGGTALGGVPTSVAAPFTITIVPVNDAPTFTGGLQISISEDAPPSVFPAWATLISAGPGEGTQSVSFTVGCSNPALFSILPAIDALGTLSFTPAPNANGSATLAVRVHDNGGTDLGGCDSSAAATAVISIVSVNDVPRIVISGSLEIPFATTGSITITATDADNNAPGIRTGPLPSFVSFTSASGSGIGVLTCASTADTGTYPIIVTAYDAFGTVDSIVRIHVNPTPTGIIEIAGAPSDAVVSLYATSGWTGKPVRTGPGTISRLTVGTYLLSVVRPGSRIEYYIAEARPNGITTINVTLRQPVPAVFATAASFASASGPLDAGTPVSVVFDDLDNDGKRDVVFLGADGVVRVARNNGTVFEAPVAVVSLFGGRNTLRCIDWNADGINDILSVNISGAVRVSFGKGTLAFRADSLLFNVTPGCSGVELVPGGAERPTRCYFSYSNGNVACVQISGTSRTTLPVRLSDGTALDVGDDANLTVFDINGDGRFELLIGNAVGNVDAYTLVAADTVRSIGKVVAGGMPLAGTGGIMLSATYGDAAGELPKIVYSDGNGALFMAKGILRGDINADGTVDVLDLQQLGVHWGQRGTDAGWAGTANLSAGNSVTDPQVINVLDLQVLGNCWGLRK